MDNAFARSTAEVLTHFAVSETGGLSEAQVASAREKYGRNGKQKTLCATADGATTKYHIAIAEDPPTPLWELILEVCGELYLSQYFY
jgi:hypothetical protein